MTKHKATEDQWAIARNWWAVDEDGVGYLDSCVLELLDRIAELEEKVYKLESSND
jgi:hypothetical protein